MDNMLRHIIAVAFPVAVCDGVHVHVFNGSSNGDEVQARVS